MDRLTEYRWGEAGMHLDGSDYPESMSTCYLWFHEDEVKELVKELTEAREELRQMRQMRQMRELLKRAGNALDIHSSQKIRALRFQILNYLRGSSDEQTD